MKLSELRKMIHEEMLKESGPADELKKVIEEAQDTVEEAMGEIELYLDENASHLMKPFYKITKNSTKVWQQLHKLVDDNKLYNKF